MSRKAKKLDDQREAGGNENGAKSATRTDDVEQQPEFKELVDVYTDFVADFRERCREKYGIDLPAEDNPLCPFCGWNITERGNSSECPHLLTDLWCDWDDLCPDGTCGGAWERLAQASLRPLHMAVKTFLRPRRGVQDRIAAVRPARLRSLVEGVNQGAEISYGRLTCDINIDGSSPA
jgi:hypothetical protein